jgi:hypothetical protein
MNTFFPFVAVIVGLYLFFKLPTNSPRGSGIKRDDHIARVREAWDEKPDGGDHAKEGRSIRI